ncbi:MAG TPA: Mur ligase family protein [Dokdonella sp.]|uniref:glutamate ligase domain-containing protein n=1 Tax=Dokdonella sp. TaxID=2291710 RepID=UPI0025C12CCE|nr:Mur ligase family protein [Dokdonella sp.]MBX3692065.1 Mur ligase [Dokdonella sp.]MCW5568438.1 Mur ligase [Dokdonella sp.]HNR92434.1 Mur ligase family protein [Dokdonella sp.]
MLETVGAMPSSAMLDAWRARVGAMRAMLGWPQGAVVARVHRGGASLAFTAPIDQLLTATEVNEWAWNSLVFETGAGIDDFDWQRAPGHPAAWDAASAHATLLRHAHAERNPALLALVAEARRRGLNLLVDDTVSIGSGTGVLQWPCAALPAPHAIDWHACHDIPVALVTGSNGKTTTVRLLATMARAHGWTTAHSCTDGLFVDGEPFAAGDYSGPAGARAVLRVPRAQAAILETARGGLLRRGIAPSHARCAVVTNISDDHFGEYGVYTLDDLAAVKLTVARVVDADGLLVLNADDAMLVRHAPAGVPLGWFALDDEHPLLVAHRGKRGTTCGVRDGHLVLTRAGVRHDLGAIAAMPLSHDGAARYNIANIAAAALAADALGIAATTIAGVLARFGARHADNPGRLQRWRIDGATVLVDYAHNPDGLRGLLAVAAGLRAGHGRLVLVFGQAGNRGDAEIGELAAVAAAARPDRIVLKDMPSLLRGRAPGEMPTLLRAGLVRAGFDATRIVDGLDEITAAHRAVEGAGDGDVVVLPIHTPESRAVVCAWLDGRSQDIQAP